MYRFMVTPERSHQPHLFCRLHILSLAVMVVREFILTEEAKKIFTLTTIASPKNTKKRTTNSIWHRTPNELQVGGQNNKSWKRSQVTWPRNIIQAHDQLLLHPNPDAETATICRNNSNQFAEIVTNDEDKRWMGKRYLPTKIVCDSASILMREKRKRTLRALSLSLSEPELSGLGSYESVESLAAHRLETSSN